MRGTTYFGFNFIGMWFYLFFFELSVILVSLLEMTMTFDSALISEQEEFLLQYKMITFYNVNDMINANP